MTFWSKLRTNLTVRHWKNNQKVAYGKSYEYRTTYDGNGNPTKSENLIDRSVDNYTTNTYGPADLQSQARPVHKGHPVIKSPLGSNANLITCPISYDRQNGQSAIKRSETTYVYEFNAKGYVSVNRSISKRYNALGNFSGSSEGTVTYTYTGCN
ncbi:hypothetical protein LZD49_12275 [Dyadobacter sp. CY261]|uniref:hypothetical protein n=1 Tax=Dyadobacter sp. CY261 TaxID=2907203 RepID=UPI001F1CC3E2|nr:hypothetical protein [Dyadobacter sp. CY261]MCF0071249.1 hypothetical protein [Dyadobacter sp. CY261]